MQLSSLSAEVITATLVSSVLKDCVDPSGPPYQGLLAHNDITKGEVGIPVQSRLEKWAAEDEDELLTLRALKLIFFHLRPQTYQSPASARCGEKATWHLNDMMQPPAVKGEGSEGLIKPEYQNTFKPDNLSHSANIREKLEPSLVNKVTHCLLQEMCPLFWLCKTGDSGPCTSLKYEIIHEWKRRRLQPCQMHCLSTVSALNSVLISWLLPIFPWENKSFWPILPHVPALTKQSLYTRTLYSAYAAIKQLRGALLEMGKKKTHATKSHLHWVVTLWCILKLSVVL